MALQHNNVRTRFAPSPTGFVHIGNFRTALFGYLFAKHNNGTFILRIEDTDRARLVEGAVENLLRVMQQLGVIPDEGFYLDTAGQVKERGPYAPYLQSQRLPLYQKHALELIEKSKAYYCFCSEQRLEELRKEQIALKKPPMYDRHCRNFSKEQVHVEMEKARTEGRNAIIRFAIPLDGQTTVHDVIYGDIVYENALLDDQVILKSDGFPTYHLAATVDDHVMEITHVTRTDEWLPSTPKHLLLYQAFGWEPPQFAHLPLVLNPDKSKLSKRQGDVATEDFLHKGYLPQALINFVAFLGWNPKTEQEIFSLDELIAQFDLAKVNKAGAVFDIHKLDWINSHYIRSLSVGELATKLIPYWQAAGHITLSDDMVTISALAKKVSKDYLEAIGKLEQERLKKLSEIGERTAYFFAEPEYDGQMLIWKKSDRDTQVTILGELQQFLSGLTDKDWSQQTLETQLKQFIADHNYDNGSVLWPLRVALTGMQASPGPFEVASVLASGLGKEVVIGRIATAIEKL
jgi:nondiscriminating glutamyl-tRNA synthetase